MGVWGINFHFLVFFSCGAIQKLINLSARLNKKPLFQSQADLTSAKDGGKEGPVVFLGCPKENCTYYSSFPWWILSASVSVGTSGPLGLAQAEGKLAKPLRGP